MCGKRPQSASYVAPHTHGATLTTSNVRHAAVGGRNSADRHINPNLLLARASL
jgi:hypothetical protein